MLPEIIQKPLYRRLHRNPVSLPAVPTPLETHSSLESPMSVDPATCSKGGDQHETYPIPCLELEHALSLCERRAPFTTSESPTPQQNWTSSGPAIPHRSVTHAILLLYRTNYAFKTDIKPRNAMPLIPSHLPFAPEGQRDRKTEESCSIHGDVLFGEGGIDALDRVSHNEARLQSHYCHKVDRSNTVASPCQEREDEKGEECWWHRLGHRRGAMNAHSRLYTVPALAHFINFLTWWPKLEKATHASFDLLRNLSFNISYSVLLTYT